MATLGDRNDQPFVDSQVFDRVVASVALGEYHLVLGAGASQGCRNSQGYLPLGDELERLLLELIGTRPDRPVGLQRAYEAACDLAGTEAVLDFLKSRYSSSTPSDWHQRIPELAWETIWSFNIDDVIENAYMLNERRQQRLIPKLWKEELLPSQGVKDAVPLVHLHGYAGHDLGTRDPQLIFGWQQYLDARATATQGNWHSRFRSSYPQDPVIVLGATLQELDLREVLAGGNASKLSERPSLIVRPGIDAFDRNEYERWGLLPVDATAEDFITYLVRSVQAHRDSMPTDLYETRYTQRTIIDLPRNDVEPPSVGHDFYGGHEPEWSDIQRELDATPDWMSRLIDDIPSVVSDWAGQQLILLRGAAFAGKSTALLRVARELQHLGWDPYYLGGRERLSVGEILSFLRDRPRAVLLCDSVAHDALELGQILSRGNEAKQRVLILGAERGSRTAFARRVINSRYIVGIESRVFIDPTPSLWAKILDKRRQHARLGRLERADPRTAQLHFVQHGMSLYDSLAALEDADGFIDRGLRVYRELDERHCLLFTVVGLLGSYGFPTPLSVASAVSRLSPLEVAAAASQHGVLAEWVDASRTMTGHIQLRHRFLGDLLRRDAENNVSGVPLAAMAQTVAMLLADRVDLRSMQEGRVEYRIVSALMDVESVRGLLGRAEVDEWYEPLARVYGKNARFWEQRALAIPARFDVATSYANRAVSVHRDPFTLTTLGTVLMRRAVSEAGETSGAWRRYWREASDALLEAREVAFDRPVLGHPLTTFLHYTLRLLEAAGKNDARWQEEASAATRDWRQAIAASGIDLDPSTKAMVERLPSTWRASR